MDHGTLILNSVVDACKSWGLSEYMTQTESLLKISGAPGQVFDIEVEDDRDEATLWIDDAHFHTHFGENDKAEDVAQLVKDLLSGESTAQARYRRKKWVASRITGERGFEVGSVTLNPFIRFFPERIETLQNKVSLRD